MKQAQLAKHAENLHLGDPARGRDVFFSEKSKCSACHQIGQQGKQIGPDLTTIGANRSARDLLESIILPSSSIVRDYESLNVVTGDGKAHVGLLASETADKLKLQLSTGEFVAIERDDIEQISPSSVSIMPNGLDEALTDQQLADVIAFLRGLK